jgi:hypothetical protein
LTTTDIAAEFLEESKLLIKALIVVLLQSLLVADMQQEVIA